MILVLAPSNATRTEVIPAERTSLPMTIFLSLRFAFDFITDSIRSLPMPHLIFLLVFLALPILIGVSSKEKLNGVLRNVILPVLVILIAIWLITAAVQAPSVMFYGAPPDPRGKSLARFVMLAGLAGIAWLLGRELNSRWNNTWVHSIAILAVIPQCCIHSPNCNTGLCRTACLSPTRRIMGRTGSCHSNCGS
ncbi:MAG: hypothetical protein IPP55_16510 [Anaerolineales bacterium]|nr:hypothetical protein [Anaerolineales bacterium]